MAKGSLAELRTQIEIAFNIGYLSKADYQKIEQDCEELAKMLGRLIQARQKSFRP
jgi:four helix bundle protein